MFNSREAFTPVLYETPREAMIHIGRTKFAVIGYQKGHTKSEVGDVSVYAVRPALLNEFVQALKDQGGPLDKAYERIRNIDFGAHEKATVNVLGNIEHRSTGVISLYFFGRGGSNAVIDDLYTNTHAETHPMVSLIREELNKEFFASTEESQETGISEIIVKMDGYLVRLYDANPKKAIAIWSKLLSGFDIKEIHPSTNYMKHFAALIPEGTPGYECVIRRSPKAL